MARINLARGGAWLVPAVVVVLLATVAVGAERQRKLKAGLYNPKDATVEMFSAIDAGDIEVKLIPKDSTETRVLITNKTDRPLNVKLPDAFAGVPVLAQIGGLAGGGVGGGGGRRGQGGGGGSQGFGGGMGGMGMGGMGGMGMGGMMNVKPEKVGNLKAPTVCLEHGKHDPRPEVAYAIKPIDQFTDKGEIRELCTMLGQGRLNQRAAQAAAWHFSDGMSWQELAAKQLRFANGTSQPYFSPAEIQAAMQIASSAVALAKERQKATKTDKPDSMSNQP
ncbi:MAG TPA: hypothetical protein VJL29_05705 [Thermoguttaceae bacterium]|nr:hypothetical protein [Thermoguttaceae bacterium]